MQELTKALTRLANAAAEYMESKRQPFLPPTTTAVEPEVPKTRKPRTPKAKALAAVVPTVEAGAVEMTEAESVAEMRKALDALLARFQTPKDGKPEGFNMAKKLLADEFKVTKTADLVHAQRLQFIAKVKALVAQADKQPNSGTDI